MSTGFPQPAPGSAPSPGPMKVEADRLKKVLGLTQVSFHGVNHPIAVTDVPLEGAAMAAADHGVSGSLVVANQGSYESRDRDSERPTRVSR
jgi:hypothetical protein